MTAPITPLARIVMIGPSFFFPRSISITPDIAMAIQFVFSREKLLIPFHHAVPERETAAASTIAAIAGLSHFRTPCTPFRFLHLKNILAIIMTMKIAGRT